MPLQDSDNFIIGRGEDSYKISYQDLKDDLNYVPPPVGTIDTPTVLEPNEGAGGGDKRYLKSDTIIDVEGGGVETCETKTIENVESVFYGSDQQTGFTEHITQFLSFPWEQGFDGDPDTHSLSKSTFTWTPDISNIKTIDIYAASGSSNLRTLKITVNGTPLEIEGTGTDFKTTPFSWTLDGGTITSI